MSRIPLDDSVHFRNGFADLVDALSLLIGGGRNLSQQSIHSGGCATHLEECLSGLLHQFRTMMDATDRALDQNRRVPGGVRSAQRQIPHLLGNHGKPCTRLSCPGCFNGRIECQKIRLKGNFIDGLDDLLSFLAGFRGFIHRRDEVLHGAVGFLHHLNGFLHQLLGLARVARILFDHGSHLLESRGSLLERRRLLGGPFSLGLARRRNFARSIGHLRTAG